MCFKWWRRPITPVPPRPRLPDHNPISASRSSASSSNDFSRDSQFSNTSNAGSLAGIKEMLPDGPIRYRLAEIGRATGNFSSSHKIGNSVWKGVLRDRTVAIVRKQGSVGSFKQGIRSICAAHHGNVVKLLGGCSEGGYLYLVYEFVTGQDLRSCLRRQEVPGYTVLSTWRSRMQIALDVAKGLEYIHQNTGPGSVHKYIKSSNILVSNTLRAKIAFFGVAALTGEANTESPVKSVRVETAPAVGGLSKPRMSRSHSLKIMGTQGYMAPEYMSSGIITQQYDVFALGVVLLELLSGQEAVTFQQDTTRMEIRKSTLVEGIHSVIEDADSRAKLRLWIDRRLGDSYPVDDALKVTALANSCVNPDPKQRPEMSDVAGKLSRYFDSAIRWERGRRELTGTTLEAR